MTDIAPRTPGPENLEVAWGLADAEQVERLDRLKKHVAELLGEELIGAATVDQLAARELLRADGAEAPVADWIAELDAGADPARRLLLLDALTLYSEHHGFHGEIAGWAQRLLTDEAADEGTRAGAMRALARSRPEPLVAEWLKGLGSEDPEARLGAINLLAESRALIAVRPLASLVVEGDVRIVQAAMWALGEIGQFDPVAEAVLVDAIKAHFFPGDAVVALGKLGGPDALRVLLEEASRAEAVPALLAAARLVERYLPFDLPEAQLNPHLTTLKTLLSRSDDPKARALVLVLLARLGQPLTEDQINSALALS